VRRRTEFADFVPILVQQAKQLKHNQFDKVINRFIARADRAYLRGCLQAAVEIAKIFELAVQAEFESDCAARRAEHGDDALNHLLSRTIKQRKFFALHQTCRSIGVRPRPEHRCAPMWHCGQ
jgi:hypothetical protein